MSGKRKSFAEMESRRPSGELAARAALRSRTSHPTSVRLDEVQANPQNPRYDYDDPETQELANTLEQVGQLQPALVVAREQYLQTYPDQEEKLGPEPWVVIVGNRRLAASHLASRTSFDVRVADDLESEEAFEDRILIENIQRKDLPPLLEAERLQRRLNRPGQTTRSVGEAIGKSHAYVQQRVDLLRMIPEFKALFRDGAISIKTGRQLAVLTEERQRAIFAAGPPFALETRKKAAEDRAVDDQPTSDTGEEPGNPVSTEVPAVGIAADPTANGQPTSDTGEEPGNPVSTEVPAVGSADGDGTSTTSTTHAASTTTSRPEENGRRTPASPHHDLDATRASVEQRLDSALAELDRTLPAAGESDLGTALADARQLIEQARSVLRRAPAAVA
jgi:ParB family chromosome partitioning protein